MLFFRDVNWNPLIKTPKMPPYVNTPSSTAAVNYLPKPVDPYKGYYYNKQPGIIADDSKPPVPTSSKYPTSSPTPSKTSNDVTSTTSNYNGGGNNSNIKVGTNDGQIIKPVIIAFAVIFVAFLF